MMMIPRLPPGPRLHLVRFVLSQMLARSGAVDVLALLQRFAKEYGDIVYWQVAHRKTCLVNHPELIHEVLAEKNAYFTKSADARRAIGAILGQGLLLNEGASYKRQRRLLQPAFHHRVIQSYAQIMVDKTRERMAEYAVGQEHDMVAEMTRITLTIVCKALFDVDVAATADRAGSLVEVLQRCADRDFKTLLPLPDWIPTLNGVRKRRAIQALDQMIYGIIFERRQAPAGRGDLLSMLLDARDEAGEKMDDVLVRDELITLFLAGHETTASSLVWALFLLSQHPDCEARLRAELRSVLGMKPPTLDDLPRLTYTTQVFKEAMRLYPSAWAIGRNPISDIEIGGYTIPRGTLVLCCPYVTQRDARFFPNPEEFRPERFAPEVEKQIPRSAYFPFGVGPRSCIGQGFVMMEAPLLLATLLQGFRFALSPGQNIQPAPLITLRPQGAVRMQLQAPVSV